MMDEINFISFMVFDKSFVIYLFSYYNFEEKWDSFYIYNHVYRCKDTFPPRLMFRHVRAMLFHQNI